MNIYKHYSCTDQYYLILTFYFHLIIIFRTECAPEQAVPASTSTDQMLQQPVCYPEDEEEEIYISELMQEITDGTLFFPQT